MKLGILSNHCLTLSHSVLITDVCLGTGGGYAARVIFSKSFLSYMSDHSGILNPIPFHNYRRIRRITVAPNTVYFYGTVTGTP